MTINDEAIAFCLNDSVHDLSVTLKALTIQLIWIRNVNASLLEEKHDPIWRALPSECQLLSRMQLQKGGQRTAMIEINKVHNLGSSFAALWMQTPALCLWDDVGTLGHKQDTDFTVSSNLAESCHR
jgi:hypothetical protein